MLVLGRKPNQTIIIDTPAGKITVQIARIRNGQAVVGIDAPKEYPIYRGEHEEAEYG